ncbi:MAG: hypothetical protein L0Z53_22125, partial [Acidobacteriales bacterium]|nr:hypothetical protein [Terriglobales bacterium]
HRVKSNAAECRCGGAAGGEPRCVTTRKSPAAAETESHQQMMRALPPTAVPHRHSVVVSLA